MEILDKQMKTRVIKVNDLPVAPIMKSCSLEYMYSKLTNIDEEEYKESEWTVTPLKKREAEEEDSVIFLNTFIFTWRKTFKHWDIKIFLKIPLATTWGYQDNVCEPFPQILNDILTPTSFSVLSLFNCITNILAKKVLVFF